MSCFIQLLKVNSSLPNIDGVHTTSDINTDNVRDCLIHDSHGRSDRAALSGMDIGHDSDPAAFSEFVIAHAADLLDCFFLDYACIAYRSIDLSLYL